MLFWWFLFFSPYLHHRKSTSCKATLCIYQLTSRFFQCSPTSKMRLDDTTINLQTLRALFEPEKMTNLDSIVENSSDLSSCVPQIYRKSKVEKRICPILYCNSCFNRVHTKAEMTNLDSIVEKSLSL
mmetsp:Transcript_4948/g.5129  ORF Transcript_4948/g.5129 Transcript_4948/m.5129 type:complete len:127 (-) Transcript_4948:65-445(-)